MAEGWAKKLKPGLEIHSAGIAPKGLDPRAVKAMAEAGVDIAGQKSKHYKELGPAPFDYVVTVCGHAHENCPVLPGLPQVVHVGFEDPPALAAGAKTEAEALAPYRRVRDEIRRFVERLPDSLSWGK